MPRNHLCLLVSISLLLLGSRLVLRYCRFWGCCRRRCRRPLPHHLRIQLLLFCCFGWLWGWKLRCWHHQRNWLIWCYCLQGCWSWLIQGQTSFLFWSIGCEEHPPFFSWWVVFLIYGDDHVSPFLIIIIIIKGINIVVFICSIQVMSCREE